LEVFMSSYDLAKRVNGGFDYLTPCSEGIEFAGRIWTSAHNLAHYGVMHLHDPMWEPDNPEGTFTLDVSTLRRAKGWLRIELVAAMKAKAMVQGAHIKVAQAETLSQRDATQDATARIPNHLPPSQRAGAISIINKLSELQRPMKGEDIARVVFQRDRDGDIGELLAALSRAGVLKSGMRMGEYRGYGLPGWIPDPQ
jgi:hypothetical protein